MFKRLFNRSKAYITPRASSAMIECLEGRTMMSVSSVGVDDSVGATTVRGIGNGMGKVMVSIDAAAIHTPVVVPDLGTHLQ